MVPPPPESGSTSSSVGEFTKKEDDANDGVEVTGVEGEVVDPDNPDLPYVSGDYDWDEKYKDDPDWITGDQVPGKMVISMEEYEKQCAALDELEKKYLRRQALVDEWRSRRVGFTPVAEAYNGRMAMFFLTVGLLTELWTGVDMPGQIEELARILGIIGFE